jgi:hypothetical protein
MTGSVETSASPSTTGWILAANVRALIQSLAALVDYEADDWDWDAIEAGLSHSDADDPQAWYDYPLVGTRTLRLDLAHDPCSNITSVQVHHPADEVLAARIETVMSMLAHYRVSA